MEELPTPIISEQETEAQRWEKIASELDELRIEFLTSASPVTRMEFAEQSVEFAELLRNTYNTDVDHYRLWYLLADGTVPNDGRVTRFDFEGDESIEKFIREHCKV